MTEAANIKAKTGPFFGMRWFGDNAVNTDPGYEGADPVTIENIKGYGGVTDVVSALYPGEVPPGDVWSEEDIARRKISIEFKKRDDEPKDKTGFELYRWYHQHAEKTGLTWRTVESLIFTEEMKNGDKENNGTVREQHIANYKKSLENLGKFNEKNLEAAGVHDAGFYGMKNVMGNFMLMADWTRTGDVTLPDGSSALKYEHDKFTAFDIFILKRHEGEAYDSKTGQFNDAVIQEYIKDGSYNEKEIEAAKAAWKNEAGTGLVDDAETRVSVMRKIVAGLPGANNKVEKGFDNLPTTEKEIALQPALTAFREGVRKYKGMTVEDLRKNIAYFTDAIEQTAKNAGINMCSHPDDPAYTPFMGTPRAVGDVEGYKFLLDHGFGVGLCPGSLMANENNRDITSMIYQLRDYAIKTGKFNKPDGSLDVNKVFPHVHLRPIETKGKDFTEGWHNDHMEELNKIIYALADIGWTGVYRPDHSPTPKSYGVGKPGYHGIGRALGGQVLAGLFHSNMETIDVERKREVKLIDMHGPEEGRLRAQEVREIDRQIRAEKEASIRLSPAYIAAPDASVLAQQEQRVTAI